MSNQPHESASKVIVIGAGIGGLTTAALLAKAGFNVRVLEAHVYPGGCAGTFYHKGYRFDAGATLAGGFYPGGPMDIVAQRLAIQNWPTIDDVHTTPAMTVHFPDGSTVDRWGSSKRHQVRQTAFGSHAESFFRWQEKTADLLWDLAVRMPPWPPQSVREAAQLVSKGTAWLWANLKHLLSADVVTLLRDSLRPIEVHVAGDGTEAAEKLRLFVDAQLLIASQTTGHYTNALYGASALDLPRRGVVHLYGGIGAIAKTIADALLANGGLLNYREEVSKIVFTDGKPAGVITKRGKSYEADIVVANLPPWNIRKLIDPENMPSKLAGIEESPQSGGGAFMVYAGFDGSIIPDDFPLHHQVIIREPMGEGNTVFLSLSPAEDSDRAPLGHRALTISTHTHIDPWWQLYKKSPDHYEQRKVRYTEMLIDAAERVLPGLREHAALIKPGTPVTFQRFTRREWGWVGGFPQVDLFQAWGPSLGNNLWMVGDTIFPGQSTAAVALGGLRVANTIAATMPQKGSKSSRVAQNHDDLHLVDPAGSASYG